jgi:hypothetical protein
MVRPSFKSIANYKLQIKQVMYDEEQRLVEKEKNERLELIKLDEEKVGVMRFCDVNESNLGYFNYYNENDSIPKIFEFLSELYFKIKYLHSTIEKRPIRFESKCKKDKYIKNENTYNKLYVRAFKKGAQLVLEIKEYQKELKEIINKIKFYFKRALDEEYRHAYPKFNGDITVFLQYYGNDSDFVEEALNKSEERKLKERLKKLN